MCQGIYFVRSNTAFGYYADIFVLNLPAALVFRCSELFKGSRHGGFIFLQYLLGQVFLVLIKYLSRDRGTRGCHAPIPQSQLLRTLLTFHPRLDMPRWQLGVFLIRH